MEEDEASPEKAIFFGHMLFRFGFGYNLDLRYCPSCFSAKITQIILLEVSIDHDVTL